MKKTLRLEWKRDPTGYRREDRPEVRRIPKTIAEGDGVSPGGTYLVPASGTLIDYSHAFDSTKPVFVELLNAVVPQLDIDAVLRFANRWGLPNLYHEAHVEEFYCAASDAVSVASLASLPSLATSARRRDDPMVAERFEMLRNLLVTRVRDLPRFRERIATDGSTVYQIPRTLRDFCQMELILGFPIGTCDNCEKYFAGSIHRGNRRDPHKFCKPECRKAFNNKAKKQKGAVPPTRNRVTWVQPNRR
jgi:hypothetical protein